MLVFSVPGSCRDKMERMFSCSGVPQLPRPLPSHSPMPVHQPPILPTHPLSIAHPKVHVGKGESLPPGQAHEPLTRSFSTKSMKAVRSTSTGCPCRSYMASTKWKKLDFLRLEGGCFSKCARARPTPLREERSWKTTGTASVRGAPCLRPHPHKQPKPQGNGNQIQPALSTLSSGHLGTDGSGPSLFPWD